LSKVDKHSSTETEYLPVRIGTLRGDIVLNFNLYILVSDRFVHYIKKNDPFEKERLSRLKTKGTKKLFIPLNEEPQYLEYLDQGLEKLISDPAPLADKAHLVNENISGLIENPEQTIKTEKEFKRASHQMGKIAEFLTAEKGAIKEITNSVGISNDLHQHCATVTSMSIALADEFKVTNVSHLIDLGLACMLHDIGLAGMENLFSKPLDQMTPEEREKYQNHPNTAKELLAGKPFVGPNVANLIADHEEFGDGEGYPNKAKFKKMNLLSQILNFCNAFDRYCRHTGLPLNQAAEQFLKDKDGHFDARLVNGLAKLIQPK